VTATRDRQASLTRRQACLTLDGMTDPRIIAILAGYLDPGDFREHHGDPPLSPYLLWGLFCSYTENYLADGCRGANGERLLKPYLPEGAPVDGVTPLQAMAAATVLTAQLQGTCRWMTAEARKQGASWADVGAALGISRQAAWEGFRKYADDLALEPWQRMREEFQALAGESADS
jgi:hypothetical protein